MKKLSVYYHGNPKETSIYVGKLACAQGQGFFEYDADFLKRTLPLSPFQLKPQIQLQQAQREPFDGIFGVFNDSLPDGWGLYVMDKHLRKQGVDVSQLTPIDRLSYVGNRAMGALSYRPDEGETLFNTEGFAINLNEIASESLQLYTGATEELLNELAVNGTPSGGARPKALLGLKDKQTIYGAYDLPQGFEHWIVKFPTGTSIEQKAEGRVEYLYSLMARKAGIDFPDTQLVLGEENNAYFLIKRFDRLANNQRVHMYSLAGLVNANFRVADFTYENLFKVCQMLTQSHREVNALFKRMLFNIVVGNRDDHSKNFSFLMEHDGQWRNSPAYDLTFNSGIQGEHSMLIGHSGKNIGWNDIAYLAERANIKEKTVKLMLDEVILAVSLWKNEAPHFDIPKSVSTEISDYMDVQIKRLKEY